VGVSSSSCDDILLQDRSRDQLRPPSRDPGAGACRSQPSSPRLGLSAHAFHSASSMSVDVSSSRGPAADDLLQYLISSSVQDVCTPPRQRRQPLSTSKSNNLEVLHHQLSHRERTPSPGSLSASPTTTLYLHSSPRRYFKHGWKKLRFQRKKWLFRFLADRTIGRAFGTVCRLSVCLSSSVCLSMTF